jgi:putative endonuclease
MASYAQRKAMGACGERLARHELERQGFEVLACNWRCRLGELDIVARDGAELVACEVKTRRSCRFGSPIEAITPQKAARLHALVAAWAAADERTFIRARVDVVAVLLPRRSSPVLTHYRGVA